MLDNDLENRNLMKSKLYPAIYAIIVLVSILLIYHFVADDKSSTEHPDFQVKIEDPVNELIDFSVYKDVKEKKEAFFNIMYPIIVKENLRVLEHRHTIQALSIIPIEELTQDQIDWLAEAAQYYRVKPVSIDTKLIDTLLLRADYIPPSLALTQAALESGWGSSRFSKQGNNLFGQWCFKKGCGMVPSLRDSGKAHEVSKFATVNNAVRSYIRNLNTHASYTLLREKRAKHRIDNGTFTGVSLAQTLLNYSEEGPVYVSKVTKFINQNKLNRFNTEFEQSLLVVEAE